MCGIAGYISSQKINDLGIIKKMTDIISHRGPDGEGHFIYNNIALGHRRLSIIDLSDAGHQPMNYMDRYTITYNGEVYNYIELRNDLENRGYRFRSETDTEVIMAAYDCWGVECLSKFNGMWAFVILDLKTEELFISRDRFGKKPLYYYQDDENFIFSSEIKAIIQHPSVQSKPNREYLNKYLKTGPVEYLPETAFNKIYRFPFSSYVKFKIEDGFRTFKTERFWELKPNLTVEKFNQERAKEYANQYYELLNDAVRLRLRADVKVGSALSGGLDSSSIVYLINQQLKNKGKEELQETFSSIYKTEGTQDCNESDYIDLLASRLNVNSNQIEPKERDVPRELEKVIWFLENPPDSTCISGWHTFKIVKDKGVVVTLDGQGADEQLAGYIPYIGEFLASLTLIDLYKQLPYFLYNYPDAKKNIFLSFIKSHLKFIFGDKLKIKLRKSNKSVDLNLNLNKRLANDVNSSLITLIHYSDHVSMGHSIESRMPFMDYRLVEFLASVPASYKMHNGWTKYIARLAFDKKLPNEICWRRDKMGWPIPESYWFQGGLNKWMKETVSNSSFLSKNEKHSFYSKFGVSHTITQSIRYLNLALYEKLFFKSNKEISNRVLKSH